MVYEMEPLALARQMSHLFYSKNVQMTKIQKMLEMTLWLKQEGETETRPKPKRWRKHLLQGAEALE